MNIIRIDTVDKFENMKTAKVGDSVMIAGNFPLLITGIDADRNMTFALQAEDWGAYVDYEYDCAFKLWKEQTYPLAEECK